MTDFHRLTGIAILHHPSPVLNTARVVPAIIWGEIILRGAGWLNNSKAQAAPAPGDHSWTSFSNGTWPSWPPEAPFPVVIPLNLPGAKTKGRCSFAGCASACQEPQYLQGKTKPGQEKWNQIFKGLIQSGQGLASPVAKRFLFSPPKCLLAYLEKSWAKMFCHSFYQTRPPSKSAPRKLEVFPSQSRKTISKFQTWAQVSPYLPLLPFWQHSDILMVSTDQALTLFMVWLKSFSLSLPFSPQMVLAQESNLASPSPFLITLRTRGNWSKLNWQSKEPQIVEFFFFLSYNIIYPPRIIVFHLFYPSI